MFTHDAIRLPFKFDPVRLKKDMIDLQKVSWIDHFVTQNYEGNWSVIPLTAQRGRDHPVLMASAVPDNDDFVPTPYLKECPYYQELLGIFETKLLSVRLMKLTAGSEIKEHRDYDLDEEDVRLHIPIQTNEDVHFYVNQKEVLMAEGECWYLRLSDPHRVMNNSEQDRIHLVMDMKLNDWLTKTLSDSA
ncbi:aspartyl beta-hydroxylase [Roseivirga sp. 4D4]|uniref:aspartyl/asparaginyl beta-hydroxylase domain-containing protein n=1 Tax=Roseivirga sp. 4D4 TaxID=1889784 RepID=UPI00085302D4|nr:aspartyl/asparaginyl beta-hydroxylase domain-containing protein [Roseivirga sp. 4D4]OEK03953.1 aspartyl beta-hydroxylase [Roseivirga sp. 4D4]